MEKVRRAQLEILYSGKNITKYIEENLRQFRFVDYAHGKSDEIEIVLEDREKKWHSAWFPEKGDKIEAIIKIKDWEEDGEYRLNCGIFTVDEVEYAGLPDIVTIKGVSAIITSKLRFEKKTKAYENTSIKKIAEEIAGRNGLILFFDGDDTIFKRIDQKDESDLAFLKRICEQYSYNLKVSDEKLIVYDSKKFDQNMSLFKIERGKDWIKRFRFSHRTFDIYRGCKVKYWDTEKKRMLEYLYIPENAENVGQILQVNERIEGIDKAIKRAKAELRRKNKQKIMCEITVVGNVKYNAGICCDIKGFGFYSGKYFVESVSHVIDRSQGYVSIINARKVLEY